ncbi:MAG: hypothetical protein ABQ298_03825 [Puniceicoccaceae bacterium]
MKPLNAIIFFVGTLAAALAAAAPTALPEPHYQNATITHVDITAATETTITFRWHDGTQHLGSPVTIPRGITGADTESPTVLSPYASILAYLAHKEANPPSPPVPYEVTRRQLFLVLDSELSLTRETLRASLTTEAQRIEFDEALSFHRDHPLVVSMGASLSLTPAEIDAIFIAAAQL